MTRKVRTKLGDILSSKNMGARARGYKKLQFIKKNVKSLKSPGFQSNVAVNSVKLALLK